MQTLCQARWIARLVLVWFVLFVGAAIASPIVKPNEGQMVCSAMGGMKLVMNDDGLPQPTSASLDCPLCAPVITPPAAQTSAFEWPSAQGRVLQTSPAARIADLTGTPLPPRGPPSL